MKLNLKHLKQAQSGYLYADGHVVLIHEKKDPDAGTVRWATIHAPESVGIKCMFQGRIVFHDAGFFAAMAHVELVRTHMNNYSESSKLKGIQVNTVEFVSKHGHFSIHDLPGVISSGLTIQPENADTYAGFCERNPHAGFMKWCDYNASIA